MTEQLMLTSYSQKSVDETLGEFRPYNNVIIDWELEYRDYSEDRGLIERIITVVVKQALVKQKQKKVPGFAVAVDQYDSFGDGEHEAFLVHEAKFTEQPKAISEFIQFCLSAESWADIGETRAKLLSKGLAGFECPFCGWCCEDLSKMKFSDTCMGCGKRFWDLG